MLGGAGGAGGAGGPPSSGNPFGVSPEMLKEMGGMKGLQQQAAAMWKHMDELAAKDPQEYSVRASPVAACSTIDSLSPYTLRSRNTCRLIERRVYVSGRVRKSGALVQEAFSLRRCGGRSAWAAFPGPAGRGGWEGHAGRQGEGREWQGEGCCRQGGRARAAHRRRHVRGGHDAGERCREDGQEEEEGAQGGRRAAHAGGARHLACGGQRGDASALR